MTATARDRSAHAGNFRYGDFDVDRRAGVLRCTYSVGGAEFEETIGVEGGSWSEPGVEEAARLVFLLCGISYYKAFAAPVVDLGAHVVPPAVRTLLRDFYVDGLAEFAYRNGLDPRGVAFVGGRGPIAPARNSTSRLPVQRPLVPFGGGMDSLVTVEIVRRMTPDAALFVVSRPGDRLGAIEVAAAATGLPVVRATRELDPKILRSQELGYLNGHVPVTGILSAIAVLAAIVHGRDAVVMSNEWSASVGNVECDGRTINHQYSKSLAFEGAFRAALAESRGPAPDYFSLLRPFTELWIAREFAHHPQYMKVFRSCNRAFHIDPSRRLDHWCGRCDKCAFIDLILSPFVGHDQLDAVFRGGEPLDNPALLETFRTLVGVNENLKPFECVGDIDECRAAVALASARPDRAGSPVLAGLCVELGPVANVERLLAPIGEHFIPPPYAAELRLE